MYVARILYPVEVLGPGKRIGIWMVGCKHKCKGCSNPELWVQTPNYCISAEKFKELIQSICDNFPVDGFTISGGEPFLVPNDLNQMLDIIKFYCKDILVYSGYKLETLQNDEECLKCLSKIAVLIDGLYIEELNNNSFIRGSSNQRIIVLNKSFEEKYHSYAANGKNQIQKFMLKSGGFISVGITGKNFKDDLINVAATKDLLIDK
jgi:anaerobic ribonucleoside-triphosphate reductase activating protein